MAVSGEKCLKRQLRERQTLGAFTAFTGSVYGVQCFLTEKGWFVNGFLHAMRGRFLVVSENSCNFTGAKHNRVTMWEMGFNMCYVKTSRITRLHTKRLHKVYLG